MVVGSLRRWQRDTSKILPTITYRIPKRFCTTKATLVLGFTKLQPQSPVHRLPARRRVYQMLPSIVLMLQLRRKLENQYSCKEVPQ
ncbi:hypothetical protein ANN_26403 [Periplaneta americana]|uniref:Uncharacterized protein n=1 Tax=Periplaneta americana TaxID=6978 RepID=A0ABQ8RY94_PERAM|nr:hypothetical protein ANN_26403 [Periplaneta americana]